MTNTPLTLQDLAAVRSTRASREPVRPALGAVHQAEDLDLVFGYPVGNDVRRPGNDEFASARDAAWPAEPGEFTQSLHSGADAIDRTGRCTQVVPGDPFMNVVKPAKIARRIVNPTGHQRGDSSRLYSSSASSCETISPRSNSAMPASISAICHSFSAT